ncbi:SDR family NAD(P)-dependent oxidoreductase [Patescibacteria group bacterium]|nr:SDR family NAD(P)-dependent oxidoreductase [Patescibacteria group bacterium]
MSDFTQYYGDKIILVTGGAGAIGSNLVRSLIDAGAEVIIIDNLSSGYKINIAGISGVEFIEGDIADAAVLRQAFNRDVDVVFHLAAHFANQNSVEHPIRDAETNILGTIALLEKSLEARVRRFVYGSTSCTYDSALGDFSEKTPHHVFETPYAISKFTGELYVDFFHKHHDLDAVVVRIFNSYGPFEYPGTYRNVIPNFFNTALKGESLRITGTGEETRSFTFVDDIVRGLLLAGATEKVAGEIFNLGNTRETKIIDLAQSINTLTGNMAPIVFAPRRSWDSSLRRRADITKAQSMLGYNPTTTMEDGLRSTLSWFNSVRNNSEVS